MFGTIRKHSTGLWFFLIVVMSLSMVVFFSDFQKFGGSTGGGDFGTINGQPITQDEYRDALAEVRISQFLYTGKWPAGDEATRLENETISRVFMLKKLKEMGIKASEKAVAVMVYEQLRDYPSAQLEKEILQPQGLRLADYERFVRHECALRQLIAAASVSSRLVVPNEAETLWRKENQEVSVQLAAFWTSNYMDKVTMTNGAVEAFYTNRQALYRLPERMTISYVPFYASNYFADADKRIAQLTNLTEIVNDFYFRGRNGTNGWTDENGNVLGEEAAKAKIKEDLRLNEALLAARRAATEFGSELMNLPEPNATATFEKHAAAKGLAIRTTAPFHARDGLTEIEDEVIGGRSSAGAEETVRDIVREKALALTDDRPVLFNPIPGRRAVYVIARKGKIPSEQQPLATIREKVTSDYKNFLAVTKAREAGQAFHMTLTNGLAAKKSFMDICVAEKVKVIDLPPISAATRSLTNVDSRVNLRNIQMALDMEVGQASGYITAMPSMTSMSSGMPQMEGGYIIYVKSRPAVDESKLKEQLPSFVNQLKVGRQNEAFQQWFRKQIELSKVMPPKRETTINAAQQQAQ